MEYRGGDTRMTPEERERLQEALAVRQILLDHYDKTTEKGSSYSNVRSDTVIRAANIITRLVNSAVVTPKEEENEAS